MNKERLLMIAEHLEKGELGHENFDFSIINANLPKGSMHSYNLVLCGTNGCAMGEFPIIFPHDWKFTASEGVNLIRDVGYSEMEEEVGWFLEISVHEVYALFFPDYPRKWSTSKLRENASKEEVAQGIRDYIVWEEKRYEQTATAEDR